MGVFLEHLDEQPPDGLALDLGVADAIERAKEQFGFVGMDQRDIVTVAEHRQHLRRFILAQQPVVDKDAGKLIPDRLMDQNRRDRTVDATGQAADDLGIADLRADFGHRLGAVDPHGPVAGEPRHADEVFVKLRALGGVVNLGVELHGVKAAGGVGGDGKGRVGRGAMDLKTRGDGRDMVAVAHPDLFFAGLEPAIQQGGFGGSGRDIGAAELGGALTPFNVATQEVHHHLLAITDAKDRHAKGEHFGGRHRCALGKDRGRAAGKDHRFRGKFPQKPGIDPVVGVNLAIDIQLAQAARDQLGDLRAEVDDEQTVVMGHGCGINRPMPRCKGV